METLILQGALLAVPGVAVPMGEVDVALVRVTHTDDAQGVVYDVEQQVIAGELTEGGSLPFTLELPGAPANLTEHPGSPGMQSAMYLVGAYVDGNADGMANRGDTFVGVSSDILVYLAGEVSQETVDAGGRAGWNFLRVDWQPGAAEPTWTMAPFATEAQIAVESNFMPRVHDEPLCGTVDAAGAPGPVNVGIWSAMTAEETPETEGSLEGGGYGTHGGTTDGSAHAEYSYAEPALFYTQADESGAFCFDQPFDVPPDAIEMSDYIPGIEARYGVYHGAAFDDEGTLVGCSLEAGAGQALLYVEAHGWGAALFPLFDVPMGWTLWQVEPGQRQHTELDWATGLTLLAPLDEPVDPEVEDGEQQPIGNNPGG
jgi:hypothetical protein